MKKYYFIIALFFVGNMNIFSDDCGEHISCPDKYPFKYCNNEGEICTFSENDPYDIEDINLHNGYIQVLKMADNMLPLCFEFDESGPSIIYGKVCVEACGYDLIYEKNRFVTDLNSAAYKWNCLCGIQDDSCKCKVKVGFSENDYDFDNPKKDPASNPVEMGKSDVITNCQIECDDLYIYLNHTDLFTRKDIAPTDEGDGTPIYKYGYFFVTSGAVDKWIPAHEGGSVSAYVLEYVLLNQIGQLYGLGHNNLGGVMDPDISKGLISSKTELSNSDKCMFVKLYCPEVTVSVDDEEKSENNDYNYPNPFENKTNIRFNVKEDNGANVSILIYDNLGNIVPKFLK